MATPNNDPPSVGGSVDPSAKISSQLSEALKGRGGQNIPPSAGSAPPPAPRQDVHTQSVPQGAAPYVRIPDPPPPPSAQFSPPAAGHAPQPAPVNNSEGNARSIPGRDDVASPAMRAAFGAAPAMRMPFSSLFNRQSGTEYMERLLKSNAAYDSQNIRRFDEAGNVKHGFRFEGKYYEPGENIPQHIQMMNRMGVAQDVSMAHQVVGGALGVLGHPSSAPEMRLASTVAQGVSTYGVTTGNAPLAIGAAVAAEGFSFVEGAKNAALGAGLQYARLERPLEQMSHSGMGSATLKGSIFGGIARHGLDFGYGAAEAMHIGEEWTSVMGRKVSMTDYTNLGDMNPLRAELKGISRASTNFFMASAGRLGGADVGGFQGAASAGKSTIGNLEGMGLRQQGISVALNRIAAIVEGMASQGIKVDTKQYGGLASSISTMGLMAQKDHNADLAYLQGDRAVQVAQSMQQMGQSAQDMMSTKGQMQKFGAGLIQSQAYKNLKAQGKEASLFNMQMEVDRIRGNPEELAGALTEARTSKEAKQALLIGTGMSPKEVEQYMQGREMFPGRSSKEVDSARKEGQALASVLDTFGLQAGGGDAQKGGSDQELTKNLAENEAKLVIAVRNNTGEVEKLNNTMAALMRGKILTGFGLALPTADHH